MKKQTKRIISLILSCLMILSGMTFTVFADTTAVATEPHILDFENLATSDGLSASEMKSYVGSSDIDTLAIDYSSYSISQMNGADGNATNVMKFISGGAEVLTSKRSYFVMYGSNATNNRTGTWTVDFDFYSNHYSGQYMQLQLKGHNHSFSTHYNNVISAGNIHGTSTKVNSGWHHITAEINLDKMEMNVKFDNTELGTKSIAYGQEAYLYSLAIGFSTAANSWWAIDNFTTSWKPFSHADNCSLSVTNADALRIGKVMTVNAEVYEGFESAGIYLDDTKIADLTENAEKSYAVRYLIPESIAKGAHTVKLEASYDALDEPVVKTQNVTVYEKNDDIEAYTNDFEQFTSLTADADGMSNTEAQTALGIVSLHTQPRYYIETDADTASTVLTFKNQDSVEDGVGASYGLFNAQKNGAAKQTGRLTLEFDFKAEAYSGQYMCLGPYSGAQHGFKSGNPNIVMNGKILGTNVSLTSGWHKLSAVFDLDKMQWSAKIDDTNVITASNKLKWPENAGQHNLGLYRIGVSTKGNSSWSIDNIKTGYLESEILASTGYVKGADSFNADKVVAFDAEAIRLNVRKEYGELSDDVTVEINGGDPEAVAASYADGAITVPLAGLDIAKGDTIKVTVSHDALLADGTYVDEPVIAEFVAGNSDGGAIIEENGKVTAYFGITAAAETTASAYLAFYRDDELVAITPASITVAAGSASYSFAAKEVPASYSKVKCFAWNDVTPLIKTIEK